MLRLSLYGTWIEVVIAAEFQTTMDGSAILRFPSITNDFRVYELGTSQALSTGTYTIISSKGIGDSESADNLSYE